MLVPPRQTEGHTPFDLMQFMQGSMRATGMFEDRFGKLRRRFTVDIDGQWQDNQLVVNERFIFDDGGRDRRVWRLEPNAEGFTAHCDDAVGPARGINHGTHAEMSYDIRLDLGGRKLKVRFSDIFLPVDSETLLNRAVMSKFGVKLGQAVIVFRKG